LHDLPDNPVVDVPPVITPAVLASVNPAIIEKVLTKPVYERCQIGYHRGSDGRCHRVKKTSKSKSPKRKSPET
jgi:hypothetical protein